MKKTTAKCPYCDKELRPAGWGPHQRRMHPAKPYLSYAIYGPTVKLQGPIPETPPETEIAQEQPTPAETAPAETGSTYTADVGTLIVKVQERILFLDGGIAQVELMKEERERLTGTLEGLRNVLTQLTGRNAPATGFINGGEGPGRAKAAHS